MHAVAYASGTSYNSTSAVAAKLCTPPNEMDEMKKKAKHIQTAGTFMKASALAFGALWADGATASATSRESSRRRQSSSTARTEKASTAAPASAMRHPANVAMPARKAGAMAQP